MKHTSTRKATTRYEPYYHSPYALVLDTLKELGSDPVTLAKPLLTLARYGKIPSNPNSSLFKRVLPALSAFARLYNVDTLTNPTGVKETLSRLQDLCSDIENPVVRGIIVQMTEMVILPESEEEKVREEALMKEINVFRRVVFQRSRISWDAVMNGGDVTEFHEATPFSTGDIQYSLGKATSRIRHRILFPSISNKLIPLRSMQWLQNRTNSFDPCNAHSPAEWERIYIRSGSVFEGPSEIKQRWYLHGQSPRTYAVAGESAYFHSRYLKDVWNLLWNSFAPTEKFKRVDITRIRRSSAKYSFAMYDLTTFTSNYETHRDFVKTLASEMEYEVEIADGRHGIRTVILGDLLRDYANHCCSAVKWYTELGGFGDIPEDFHAVAGLLGIIGNIASCGFSHGLFLRTLVERIEECGVAGDDAIFVYLLSKGWKDEVKALQYLGILAEEKVYDMQEGEAVYLKRGVEADGNSLSLRQFIQFPRFLYKSPFDLERFREGRLAKENPNYLKRLFVSSLSATFKSAAGFDEAVLAPLSSIIREAYEELGLPEDGYVPGISQSHIPPFCEDLFLPGIRFLGSSDHVGNTYLDHFRGTGHFFERELPGIPGWLDIRVHSSFIAKPDSTLRYLEKIGVLKKEKILREKGGFLALRAVEEVISVRKPSLVYKYAVRDPEMLHWVHEDLLNVVGCSDYETGMFCQRPSS